jgi:hypothetical protein
LVGEHDPSLIGDCLVDDDADHPFLGDRALQHLFAEDAGEFDLVEEVDGAGIFSFSYDKLAVVSSALADLFGIGRDDYVGGHSRLYDDVHLIFAVVSALSKQEKATVDGACRELKIQEGDC